MWINSSIKNPSWCHIYVLKQTDLDGFLFNAEFCLICTRVTLTATQNPCPKHPWHLGFVAGSFLLCPKSCPSCCWIREPIPEPSESRKNEPLVFPRMDLGSSPLQVSPLQLWEWGVDPDLSTGAGKIPAILRAAAQALQKPPNLKISASVTSPALSPSIPSFLFKETNTKGGKSASKFKDKLQTGQESQPIYYPSAASDAAFPPPETTVFFSLICLFFQEFSDASVTTAFLSERLHWNIFQWIQCALYFLQFRTQP